VEATEVLNHWGLAQTSGAGPCAVWSGANAVQGAGALLRKQSPIDGRLLAEFSQASPAQAEAVIERSQAAFLQLRELPPPLRGEFVRRFGDVLRRNKQELGALVTWEAGKSTQEGQGEVQEMIDICDFAAGLSRQLYGKTIASERPGHRLSEQWLPLGPVGVISAFNFPVAVWAWNAALAWVCGDPVVWKPSEKTPLCALACHRLALEARRELTQIPAAVSSVLIGGADLGHALAASPLLPLVSATGSVRMGRQVALTVAQRLGRSLLELGGNNALVVTPSADLDLAVKAIAFSALGTAGQRCTTLRRLIVHESIREALLLRLRAAYASVVIGDPRQPATLLGPLIDEAAWASMQAALSQARAEGGVVVGGERVTDGVPAGGVYVRPALVEFKEPSAVVSQETFAPILYVLPYTSLEQAIALNNGVPQGLSSAIFSNDMRETEQFCAAAGSDCGIVNVNIGTSGAEIGGAFGGEKETGGGRESGSDSWQAYMRRVTTTVNYSGRLPLAQGIRFDLPG
jgi:aldehyde dehydrogenase (NAD+)